MNYALKDSKLRSIKAPYAGKPELSDRDGLTVRITKNGVVTFNFRFQLLGKAQRMKLGCYPEIKLAEAREQVIKLRRAVFEGNDPRIWAVMFLNMFYWAILLMCFSLCVLIKS